jgi:hypothetical protein
MTPFDRLCANIRDVLLHDWDPVGIHDVREAQDEYDRYVTSVARLVTDDSSPAALARYLLELESEITGMQGDAEKARLIAERLCRLRPHK